MYEKILQKIKQEEKQLDAMVLRYKEEKGFVTRSFSDKIEYQSGIVIGLIKAARILEGEL
ncbi:MAG: hypothetical protein Unbinned2514contig1001_4 [Prokaryotic dsDNA virus sp.]|nr:MAG: hypothetical protein Unbinned2514contig1001_4 [Prokaryotic dsDNA virus sp.]|tara:strand:- start:14190 stop:14369 length:180 start_codon:yes stop_codon:yes gene_type:complete